jgi:hypothetical protein
LRQKRAGGRRSTAQAGWIATSTPALPWARSPLSRFENAITRPALGRMLHSVADTVIATHRRRLGRRRVRRITIDLDPTDDPTHGQQELSFFSGHYGTWHYLPLLATLTFNTEAEQYLVGAVLRPGNSGAQGAIGLLRRLFGKLRRAFPRAQLRVRLDGGFAGNPLLDFLEAAGVEYIVALGTNARLASVRRLLGARGANTAPPATPSPCSADALCAPLVASAARDHEGRWWSIGRPARTTAVRRRNLADPGHVYQVYRERNDMKNRIKELKLGLALDRTSCQVSGQRLPRPAHRGGVCPLPELRQRAARTAVPTPRSGPCATDCSRSRPGAALRPAHRRASAARLPVAPHLAAGGPDRRRHRLTAAWPRPA